MKKFFNWYFGWRSLASLAIILSVALVTHVYKFLTGSEALNAYEIAFYLSFAIQFSLLSFQEYRDERKNVELDRLSAYIDDIQERLSNLHSQRNAQDPNNTGIELSEEEIKKMMLNACDRRNLQQ